jgi:hypothetical protein
MSPRRTRRALATLAFVVAAGSSRYALADAGFPMLVLAWPAALLLFVPVVLVEGLLARRMLGLSTRDALKLSLIANAWSTLLGVPLTWLALLLLEIVGTLPLNLVAGNSRLVWLFAPLYAAWLPPVNGFWPVFASGAVLCVAFFFASVWIEARSARRRVPADRALAWAKRANLVTYAPAFVALAAAALLKRPR